MSVLGEEWTESPAEHHRPRHVARWVAAAAVVLLAGTAGWAGVLEARQDGLREDARTYQAFLHALGGLDVRTASLHASGGAGLEGYAVLYDSDRGQSWVLVEVRGLGYPQPLTVTLSAPAGRSIKLPFPIKFSADGDGAAWLVTTANISSFQRVTLTAPDGSVVATGTTPAGHAS
jgi:hypothetical protein